MSKQRQSKRKQAAVAKGRQQVAAKRGQGLGETASLALRRHLVEPFQALHADDDPEPASGYVLEVLFDLSYRWDGKASFAAIEREDLIEACVAQDLPFGRADLARGIDDLVSAALLISAGETVRIAIGQDILDRVNAGERLLD